MDSSTGTMILPEALASAPDSSRIAISILDTSGEFSAASVWIVDAATGNHTELLPPSLFAVESPAWSPSGDRIAFLGEPLDARSRSSTSRIPTGKTSFDSVIGPATRMTAIFTCRAGHRMAGPSPCTTATRNVSIATSCCWLLTDSMSR